MDNNHLIHQLNQLVSEKQNPETLDIDQQSSPGIVAKINAQDLQVAPAITAVLPEIAQAVDLIVAAFKNNARLIYIGAGTSGRLGVLDAVECVPTFGVDDNQVIALIAGGEEAMFKAREGIEDDESAGEFDIQNVQLNENDVLVGIAASGRTPYVIGALKYAQSIGAKTIALSCNPEAQISRFADISILPVVGAEALTGSTRMKSGTAQKLVLNMLTTASMIRIGKSYQNLMVDVKATNKKLYARGTKMVMQITGVDQDTAEKTLTQSGMQVKVAILMLLADITKTEAIKRLHDSDGFLRKALRESGGS
ncbi:MAG TPA: N-acetylmuramic acid 6-phosphate etherase [Aeromonadales bacterium]|nr:N-acetylmuramic acid 6-phosphate etherase [Aeromonadales bacterium]